MKFISRLFKTKDSAPEPSGKPASREAVTFDEIGVQRVMQNGKVESVTWDDLQQVFIITTDEGPFQEDVYWMLAGSSSGCAVPGSAQGVKELLPRLQALPGFKNEAVIEAMGSAQNAKFLCGAVTHSSNPSIERTSYRWLRQRQAAAHVER
jgi:hypothetical protein